MSEGIFNIHLSSSRNYTEGSCSWIDLSKGKACDCLKQWTKNFKTTWITEYLKVQRMSDLSILAGCISWSSGEN